MIFGVMLMNNVNNAVVPDRKALPFGGAHAVDNPVFQNKVKNYIELCALENKTSNTDVQNQFLELYKKWILSSRLNSVIGLDLFDHACFSNGTTEAFDKFYLKHHNRKFRCFRGEYMYHQAAWRNYFPNWSYLDDEPLQPDNAVVISLPFADTGKEHPKYFDLLEQCSEMNVPVLVDCAFFGLTSGVKYHFDYPAITDITWSLSKFFPVANLRIGMRLTKVDDDDSLFVMNKTNYTNRLGAAVGMYIIQDYDSDYIYQTYQQQQLSICKLLNVEPSKSVIFGIDNDNAYSSYNRGGFTNRLNLAKYLQSPETLPHH
jgi:hypothetical protein